MRLAGELGADDEFAWSRVKRLRRLDRVCSARLGIHHRMLFVVETGALEILEVVHRKDLESTVDRLG